ncbi:hypothetical protein HYY71_02655 [Candidatus Woesearchaeota archaeon]|nr:hypothetical protein [Candidatus Woesearchaeota archaeon]
MNHTHHKFLTTAIVFVFMIVGIFVAAKFKDSSLGAFNISLLLVNSLLLLIILGILLHTREDLLKNEKKRRK